MQSAAKHRHRAVLAIDDIRRLHARRVNRSRVRQQLEGRTGLVDVAHGQVRQHTRVHMLRIVWVEPGAHGKRKNLASVRVLHNDCSVQRLDLRHLCIQRLLGHVLDICVNR